MTKIVLCCSGGMSTSMLVKSMRKSALQNDIMCDIIACAKDDVLEHSKNADLVLLGPQIKYAEDDIKDIIGKDKKLEIIDSMDYGMVNGEKVLAFALSKINS